MCNKRSLIPLTYPPFRVLPIPDVQIFDNWSFKFFKKFQKKSLAVKQGFDIFDHKFCINIIDHTKLVLALP